MRSMGSAPKDGTPILARIRPDLMATYPYYNRSKPEACAGLFVVIRHPGLADDGLDIGWSLAGPFGFGLGLDDVFEGWWPLPPIAQETV